MEVISQFDAQTLMFLIQLFSFPFNVSGKSQSPENLGNIFPDVFHLVNFPK